jgi:predicted RNase H-like HicB family nuclease
MDHYVAILFPEDKVGYSVFFPDFPGCLNQGETMAAAIAGATEALSGHVAVMREYGDKVPAPRSLEAVKADRAFAKEYEIDWKTATAALIRLRAPLGRLERINVSLDSNLLRAIDAYAKQRGLTRSAALEAGAEMLMQADPVPTHGGSAKRVGRAA